MEVSVSEDCGRYSQLVVFSFFFFTNSVLKAGRFLELFFSWKVKTFVKTILRATVSLFLSHLRSVQSSATVLEVVRSACLHKLLKRRDVGVVNS